MSMEKLFESIDKDVLTDEVKQAITDEFNHAVDDKVASLASKKFEELEKQAEEYADACKKESEEKIEEIENELEDVKDKAEKYAEACKKEYEDKIDELDDKADEYVELAKKEMSENVSNYIDRAIKDFIIEAKEQLCRNVENAKVNALTEAYSNFAMLTGVEVKDIIEAHEESKPEGRIASIQKENDRLVNENIALMNKIKALDEKCNKLLKLGLIKEMSDDLSYIEAKKFENLADMVEFSDDEDYVESLKKIKETVKNTSDDVDEDDDEEKEHDSENMNESDLSVKERLERLI